MELPPGVSNRMGTDPLILELTDTINVIQNEYFFHEEQGETFMLYLTDTMADWSWGYGRDSPDR